MEETQYTKHAQAELTALVAALDHLSNRDGEEGFDCELENDIITIDFSDGSTFVINSHRAARQIWMAADHQAWHYDYDPTTSTWRSHKTGEELWSVLAKNMTPRLPKALVDASLVRPPSLSEAS